MQAQRRLAAALRTVALDDAAAGIAAAAEREIEPDRSGLDDRDVLVHVLGVAEAHAGALAELLLDGAYGAEDCPDLVGYLAHVASCLTGPGSAPGAFARSTAARAS